jgi:hypothetical protein
VDDHLNRFSGLGIAVPINGPWYYWIDIANRTRYQYLRAKPPRLQQCAACEFVA